MLLFLQCKLKDFRVSFYSWKTSQWPNGLTPEDWHNLKNEDEATYTEERDFTPIFS